jgi:hypothetical protein
MAYPGRFTTATSPGRVQSLLEAPRRSPSVYNLILRASHAHAGGTRPREPRPHVHPYA